MNKTIAHWHKKYFPIVFKWCCRMLRNDDDASDAAQDVFLKLLRSSKGQGMDLENVGSELGILKTNTIWVCLNKIKNNKRKYNKDSQIFESKIESNDDQFEKLDAKLLIEDILNDESEDTRIYCYMYYFEGMNLEEIAKVNGKSKSLIHKKLSGFRKSTRVKLEGNIQ